MSKTLIVLFFLAVSISAKPKHYELDGYNFDKYIEDFDKEHVSGTKEYALRKQIFFQNLINIKLHNLDETQNWKKGVNDFTDMTHEEVKQNYRGHNHHLTQDYKVMQRFLEEDSFKIDEAEIPESWNWRDHGVVTPPKAQGKCGSCWAFATTEVTESHAAINSNKLLELSPQQLTSCCPDDLKCGGSGGCNGAVAQLGFTYIELFHMTTETEYPYTSGVTSENGECSDTASMAPAVMIDGHMTLPMNDQKVFEWVLSNKGPIAVSVDAATMHQYESGIYDACSFDKNIELDHAVVVDGFDQEAFYIRNSWGPNYGENGYIRVQRTNVPLCGIDTTPGNGNACVGDGLTKQMACGMCGVLSNSVIPIGAKVIQ